MKELILIRGVSGSGKSTLANMFEIYIEELRIFSISADDYFTDITTGEYNFDASKLKEAHSECQEGVKQAMVEYIADRIVVHNTFTEEWEMKPYFDLAKEYDYRVTTLIVENRHNSKSIHNVPDEVLKRQKERFNIKL
tara:strand:+ start:200 stop:613 length:414 start_codon:yes stop_codon:yes gene_type:complete